MLRPKANLSLRIWLIVAGLLTGRASVASNPYLDVPPSAEMENTPAYLYANASNEEVRQRIVERAIPFVETVEGAAGVRMPGRLTGPLHGVWVHGTDPSRADVLPYEIIDGRLALALDDFCQLLADAQIVELLHYTIYRPSSTAATGGTGLTRHAGALAIDVGALKYENGEWLRVKRDWSPSVGAKTCGPGQRRPESTEGQTIQGWVCEARQRGIFHYALTPHFDAAHADHLHLEIKPTVKWFLYN
jgi:hypothetical protein